MSGEEASSPFYISSDSESEGVPFADVAAPMAGQDDILRTMATAMQQIARNVPPSQSSILKQMNEYHAEEFRGKLDDNPTKAEYWLEQLERIFGCMTCTSDEKLQGATVLLKEEAHRWWASVARATLPEMLTWDFFLSKFRESYVGEQYIEDRRQEFLQLVQEVYYSDVDMCRKFRRGLRSIIQAGLVGLETSDLTKLPHATRTLEQLKVTEKVEEGSMNQEKRPAESSHSPSRFSGKRFRDFRGNRSSAPSRFQGQRPSQMSEFRPRQQSTSMASTGGSDRVPMCQHCGRPHHGECRKLLGTCFLCGSKDHYYRECSRGQVSSETRSAPGVQQGRGIGRGFGAARGQRAASEPIQRPAPRAPSCAYAMRTREDSDAPDVILGTFTLFDMSVIALIDPGSTHSYICDKLIEEHSLPLEKTKYDILVSNPLGMSVVVNRIFRNCPLKVQGCLFLANLMELPFHEFDIILGMDWLYVHRALVDCGKKRIILYTLDGHEVIVVGERSDYLDNVISATTARKLS
ncbi:hypothetical protein SASPL_143036 [Salvia splendens]|uniref:Retrotransposon gag domain-containing protein n=1 Tax=Salvia splendens TaxID=180675 RepID=A0A8X8WKU6_SALSN|nr:hypothetical protein SASPL_143036 [Salvia splendens]